MKVICIYEGNQKNSAKVVFLETYTVVKVVKGWELLHSETDSDFYILEEMPSDQAYHSKLFAQTESKEVIVMDEQLNIYEYEI